jgi:5-methylcytosine-specific restriction endonuclease McrA
MPSPNTSRTGTTAYLRARSRLLRRAMRLRLPCHLCGKPIDYSLRTPDPGSFEADHVSPHSLGGTDDLDNLRPSHRRCNRARSNRPDARPRLPTTREW